MYPIPCLRQSIFAVLLLPLMSACVPAERNDAQPARSAISTTPPLPPGKEGAATPLPPKLSAALPDDVPTVKIGLLLPLSGESQALGQAMLDAASLALYDQYVNLPPEQVRTKIVLLPKDTGTAPAGAANAARMAVEQGASLIIGPVFGSGVTAAAPIARKANIPLISLSNNRAVAGAGVYVYGFLPEQQVTRVAEYAALQKISSFAALLPNDAYGAAVGDALKKTLTAKGLQVSPVESYARTPNNIEAAAIRMKEGLGQTPAQALFLADSGDSLKTALKTLPAKGVPLGDMRLLGTGLWDDAEVQKLPALAKAWFASGPSANYDYFERRFQASYNYKPQRLASLAYDAVTLAASLALTRGGPDYEATTLTRSEGFIGPANGLYRLKADGTAERGLAVMEIRPQGAVVLEAAPKSF